MRIWSAGGSAAQRPRGYGGAVLDAPPVRTAQRRQRPRSGERALRRAACSAFSFAPSVARVFWGGGLPRARAWGYSQTPRWGLGSFRDRLPGAYAARLSSTAPSGLGLAEAGVGPEAGGFDRCVGTHPAGWPSGSLFASGAASAASLDLLTQPATPVAGQGGPALAGGVLIGALSIAGRDSRTSGCERGFSHQCFTAGGGCATCFGRRAAGRYRARIRSGVISSRCRTTRAEPASCKTSGGWVPARAITFMPAASAA